MKAVAYRHPLPIAEQQSLIDVDLPKPDSLGPRDLLVAVKAVSVNPADTKLRRGASPAQPGEPRVLGFDAAGVVEATGSGVTLFKPGDEVFYAGDFGRPGSNSEFQLVDERIVGRKPVSLSFAEAAALPLTALTAWELLFDRLRVPYGVKTQGGVLLILGAAGGVGSILIQLARRLTGLTVVATASRPETEAWVRRLGAHHVIDHHGDLAKGLGEIGIGAVDFVAGLTATGRYMPAITQIIAPQGHLSLIDDYDTFDIAALKAKSVTVSWEMVFTRPRFGTADMIAQHRILNEVAALIDAGVLVSTMTQKLEPISADTLKRAHTLVESGTMIGKVVVAGF